MTYNTILDDLFNSNRAFLLGGECSRNEVIHHLRKPILLDGLNREEAQLILSTLPHLADRIFLSPLDKGLSGSKVFAAKFDIDDRRVSKIFVLKIGEKNKIGREYTALKQFAAPHIHGVIQPIYRVGKNQSLIVQELAGLSSKSKLISLKNYIRNAEYPEKIISRLFNDRLGNWYFVKSNSITHNLGELFQWYLTKINDDIFPSSWSDLKKWVFSITEFEWHNPKKIIDYLKNVSIDSVSTIVHGDMHSQNVLIDEREECWIIDYAWCHNSASPILDFTMLECSLKFLAIPQMSDLRSLISIEKRLCLEPFPKINIAKIPYSREIQNVINGILAVRNFAIEKVGLSFEDYRKALCLMTYVHSTHPMLNLPYVLSSLQILSAIENNNI